MKIIYVHHGQRKKGNPPSQNDDLTELGYEDCELISKLLNDEKLKVNLKAIYSSSFLRCTKTAEIINKLIKLPIFLDDRLNEFGSVEGETWVDLQNRVMDCIDSIINKHGNDDVVICVTSGVNISGFINKAYNLPANDTAPFLNISSCSPITFVYKK